MRDLLTRAVAKHGALVADGAMGTNLFQRGLATGEAPEIWNVEHPDRIGEVHREFIEAGANIILTNSFGGSRFRLKLHGADHRVQTLNRAAAAIARSAAEGYGGDVLVAGSIGPSGELFVPVGTVNHRDGCAQFAEQAQALADGGADLIWVETMSAREEVEAAVDGARSTGLPIVVTMTFDTNGRTMMGITPEDAGRWLSGLGDRVVAVGANCGIGPAEAILSLLDLAAAVPDKFVVAKANCGVPEFIDGDFKFTGTPEVMARYARLARNVGATIIGGCCGTNPRHLKAIADALRDHLPGDRPTAADIASELGSLSSRSITKVGEQTETRPPKRRNRRRKQ